MKIKDMNFNRDFPDFFKQLRKKKKLTQRELSNNREFDRSMVSKIEHGTTNITLENLLFFSDILGYEIFIKEKGNSDILYKIYDDSYSNNEKKKGLKN